MRTVEIESRARTGRLVEQKAGALMRKFWLVTIIIVLVAAACGSSDSDVAADSSSTSDGSNNDDDGAEPTRPIPTTAMAAMTPVTTTRISAVRAAATSATRPESSRRTTRSQVSSITDGEEFFDAADELWDGVLPQVPDEIPADVETIISGFDDMRAIGEEYDYQFVNQAASEAFEAIDTAPWTRLPNDSTRISRTCAGSSPSSAARIQVAIGPDIRHSVI